MSSPGHAQSAHKVDVIEETDLAIRVFRRGASRADRLCALTVAVNGDERLHLTERAGPSAPAIAVIDLRLDAVLGALLVRALPARPWLVEDMPVIAYALQHRPDPSEGAIRYLLRTPVVEQVLGSIRTALDLDAARPAAEEAPSLPANWQPDRAQGYA